MTIKIEVTEEDIRQGCAFSSDNCPVARALWRQTGSRCRVSPSWIAFGENFLDCALTPREVERFVLSFDRGDLVAPFSFTIDRPATEGPIPSRIAPPNASQPPAEALVPVAFATLLGKPKETVNA